jgi:hypothetical protein
MRLEQGGAHGQSPLALADQFCGLVRRATVRAADLASGAAVRRTRNQ